MLHRLATDSFLTSPPLRLGLNRIFQTLFVCMLLLMGCGAFAANQGNTGVTSSGDLDINLITGLNVRISGLADIALGVWGGNGPADGSDNLCVGRTGVSFIGQGPYRIRASGDGAPGNPAAFTLSNGVRTLEYDAFFNDGTGLVGRQQLVPGVALTNQRGSGFVQILNYLFGCFVANANISVRIPESELRGAAGAYSGTLTLVLIPE